MEKWALIVAIIPLVWAVWKYFELKRKEQRSERFNTYHKLIKELVEQDEADRPKMLDRQLAIVFEIRRYKEYYEPSLRILEGLRQSWGMNNKGNRLLDEMDATIAVIKSAGQGKTKIKPLTKAQKLILIITLILLITAVLIPPYGYRSEHQRWDFEYTVWTWLGNQEYPIRVDIFAFEIFGIIGLAGLLLFFTRKKRRSKVQGKV